MYISYLNEKEKGYILRWADDYANIFYLNGKRLSLALLYTVSNLRPYLYRRQFVLACDYEPVHLDDL